MSGGGMSGQEPAGGSLFGGAEAQATGSGLFGGTGNTLQQGGGLSSYLGGITGQLGLGNFGLNMTNNQLGANTSLGMTNTSTNQSGMTVHEQSTAANLFGLSARLKDLVLSPGKRAMEVDSLLMKPADLQLMVDVLLESSAQCPEDMLDAEPYPSDQTLVTFAELVYTPKKSGESDAAYGTRILSGKLDDWRLLITVNNTDTSNGYFAAVFYHTGLQQVVVAHRGTDPFCLGAVYTDIQGILRTKYTSCMNSAITFVDYVRQAINLVNNEHSRRYTLTITGHSLGAWLAQITSFSVKYFAISEGVLVKNPEVGIHAKTVGFDSPGARDMLNRVLDVYDRYAMNVSLDKLDITLYMSAPNRINTCGLHLGKIYRILNYVSSFNIIDKHTIWYNYATHSMSNFTNAFRNVNCIIGEVLDWASSSKEFCELFNILKWDNNYHGNATVHDPVLLDKIHRYNVAECKSPKCVEILQISFSIFSQDQLQMLFMLHILQKQESELIILNKFVNDNNLKVEATKLFPDFNIDYYNRTITCESGESSVVLCRRLRQLMRWLKPQFTEALRKQIEVFLHITDLIYYVEGQSYLDSLPKCWLDFEDRVGFRDFLTDGTKRVLCIVMQREGGAFQVPRLRNILYQIERSVNPSDPLIKCISESHYTFLAWPQLQKLIDIYGRPVNKEYLMVVDGTSPSFTLEDRTALINHVHSNSMKLVLIVSQSMEALNPSEFLETVESDCDVHLADLTLDSQKIMLERDDVMISGGKEYSFQQFLGDDCSVDEINKILSSECMKNFATVKDYAITIKDTCPTLTNLQMPFFKVNIKTSMELILSCVEANILVVMSGLSRKDMESGAGWKRLAGKDNIILAEGDTEQFFRDTCSRNQRKTIYLLDVLEGNVYCKEIFDGGFYLARKFLHRIYIDLATFTETKHVDDLFVICSEEDKNSLLEMIENCEQRKDFSQNVYIAASKEEEADVIRNYLNKNIHFVKIIPSNESYKLEWRYSRRSVESLRPCVSTGSCEPLDELTFSQTERNLVIITDEPGMGKTTSLATLSRLVKSVWVIYIELRHFQEHLQNRLPDDLTAQNVASFLLSECYSQADGSPAHKWLEYLLQRKTCSKKVVLMFDGFDEIDDYIRQKENAKENLLRLLAFLVNKPTVQTFLTTRTYLKESLERKLSQFSTKFVPINVEEQQDFLFVFWRSCLRLELPNYSDVEECLKTYAGEVLRKAKLVLGPDIDCFMGVPLQLTMLAEVFRPQSDLLVQSPEVLFRQINIVSSPNLYKKFISLKYDIYLDHKTSKRKESDELDLMIFLKPIMEAHGKLGFRTFFSGFYKKNVEDIADELLCKLNRHGLVQVKGNGEFQFVHRTYAEYCCAQMVVHWLSQPVCHFRKSLFKEILLPQILLQPDRKLIRAFMNAELEEIKMSETALKSNAECISQLWCEDKPIFSDLEGQTVLHIAFAEKKEHIITLLISWLNKETQETFVSFITQYNNDSYTALNYVDNYISSSEEDEALRNRIMSNILERSNDETKEKLFFAILFNNDEANIVNYLLESGDHKFRDYIDQINKRIDQVKLLIKPFTIAALNNDVKSVSRILFKQLQNNIERHCLLNFTSRHEEDGVLHLVARYGHLEVFKLLAEEDSAPFAVLMALRDDAGKTPLNAAALFGRLNIVQYCVERETDVNTRGLICSSALTISAAGYRQWIHHASYRYPIYKPDWLILRKVTEHDYLLIVKYLIEKGADVNHMDEDDETALYYAIETRQLQVVKYLHEGGANINYIDGEGMTALYLAVLLDHLPVVKYLLQKGADPNGVSKGKYYPLSAAIERNYWYKPQDHWDMVNLLLDSGADINVDDGRILRNVTQEQRESLEKFLADRQASVGNRKRKHRNRNRKRNRK